MHNADLKFTKQSRIHITYTNQGAVYTQNHNLISERGKIENRCIAAPDTTVLLREKHTFILQDMFSKS